MTWYNRVDNVPEIPVTLDESNKSIKTVGIISDEEPKFSVESQYVIAPHVFRDSRIHTGIHVRDAQTVDWIKQYIAPHFDRCLLFYENDLPVSVTLNQLTQETKTKFEELVNTNSLHPLIQDIYQKNVEVPDLSTFREKPVIYQISANALTGTEVEGGQLKDFLQKTTLAAEGHTSILPIGWKFGDHLKQSVYLKFLSSFCANIYLHVWPSDGTVIIIEGRL